MIVFAKRFLFELALYVLGYIVYKTFSLLGRMTLHIGRAVFSR